MQQRGIEVERCVGMEHDRMALRQRRDALQPRPVVMRSSR
jgi:hypothetical protein